MKHILISLTAAIILHLPSEAQGQLNIEQIKNMQTTPAVYNALKARTPIHIDGKADEDAWSTASWTTDFIDIEGPTRPVPRHNTKAKMLWDDDNLYIYAQLEEPHVWGNLRQRDTIIYHNNDFEIFIKPFDQHPFYFEIEINTLNTVMDLMMPKTYRLGGEAIMHWDVKGLRSAVHVEGTNNNPADVDQYWAIEMAIPFSSLTTFGKKMPPKQDVFWRINFSRVQWQHDIVKNSYQRKKANGRLVPEDNWVWSPIGVINMHHPERWGYLRFTENTNPSLLPATADLEKTVWNIFHLQQIHKKQHGKYTDRLTTLPAYTDLVAGGLKKTAHSITLNPAKSFYLLRVKDDASNTTVTIDSYGNYHINYDY
ncbi:MAG TPA: carbohydrate-binding family 9-like protein [Sphingobacterium sp.]|nr:carbohydrate-binding family 9-like protein [Sphingobacterium sp.]